MNVTQRIEEILRDLWQKNGDLCSNIYAGTGALDGKSKVTQCCFCVSFRDFNLMNAGIFQLKDASRSIARTIQNNLMDGSKQESFDIFLFGAWYDMRVFDRAANLLPNPILQGTSHAFPSRCHLATIWKILFVFKDDVTPLRGFL